MTVAAKERKQDVPLQPDARDYRATIGSVWVRLRQLAEEEGRQDLLSLLEPLLRRFELGIFRLVVMGEIKKGKSSFINALLGESDLLPTQSDVATSTVYKILYGPKRKFKVFFLPDIDTGKRREPKEITEAELRCYGTEDGNPKNEKQVDFIGVELPSAMLKEGLVLVDTPGVGGLYKAHRDISLRYVPNADAVFFVLDSVEAVISKDEIEFLQYLTSKLSNRVFFVQTKTDLADTEQWQAWQARNKQILTDKLGPAFGQLYYFPVSSKLKQIADKKHDGPRLAESGFLAVLDFLHHGLMEIKDCQSACDVARRMAQTCQQIGSAIQEQMHIYRDRSKEESERLRQDYCNVQRELDQWGRTTYQEQVQRFGDSFSDLQKKSHQRLLEELDPCGPIVTEVINKLRVEQADPKKIADAAQQIQQEWLAVAAERVGQIQREFNSNASTLLSETSKRLYEGWKTSPPAHAPVPRQAETLIKLPTEQLSVHFSQFETLRNAVLGGSVGGMMAHVGVIALAFVFPPAAAVAGIAAFAGPIIGAWCATADMKSHKLEEVLARLHVALQTLARRCQQQAINQFTEAAASYERCGRDSFKDAAEKAKDTLQQRLKQLEEAGSHTKEENLAKGQQLQRRLQEIASTQQSLRSLLDGVS